MHDLIIIGGGPAGLSGGIYAQRFKLKTLLISKEVGGLLQTTHLIENWPGEKQISGPDLMNKIEEHAKNTGLEIINDEVINVEKNNNGFKISTKSNKEFECKSILLATGTSRRKLSVPGEAEYSGRGVSYCATCDAPFFKNKIIGVVGGSDSAVKESLLLAEYASKVYIIFRKDKLSAEPINTDRALNNDKVELISKSNVIEIKGNGAINKVILDNPQLRELELDGLFIEVGQIPKTELAKSIGCKLNDKGEVMIDRQARTSIPRVYSAGDCTDSPNKQGITAASEGVTAVFSAYEDLMKS